MTGQLDGVRGCVEMNVKGAVVPGCFADLVQRGDTLRELARRTRRKPGYEANVRLGEALAQGVAREARYSFARSDEVECAAHREAGA